jgi:hypothetical protein
LIPEATLHSTWLTAYTALWAATSPREKVRESYYWQPVGSKSAGSFWHAQKTEPAKQLWEWTEEQFKKIE